MSAAGTATGAAWRRPVARHALVTVVWTVLLTLPLLAHAGRFSGGVGVAALLVTAAPLTLRHRWPILVLALVGMLAALSWAWLDGEPVFPVVLVLLGVHAVALSHHGSALWWSVGVTATAFATLTGAAALERDGAPAPSPLTSPFVLAGLLAAATLLGTNARVRREHLAALEERALQLEVERDQRARIAVAAERAQIARELHDVVAHSLTVIVRLSDGIAAQAAMPAVGPGQATALAALSSTGRQALTEMRRLLDVLRDDEQDDAAGAPLPPPGPEQLDELLRHVRAAGLPVSLTRQGDSATWSAGTGLAVHRIIQEALTNVLKHAGPGATADITVRTGRDRVEVVVDDDGPDTPGAGSKNLGRGLVGMRERAASFGGALAAGPRPEGGWRVRAELEVDRL